MAGTDKTRAPSVPPDRTPAIILVVPQLGENIGAVARAMYNFGLDDLRLVRPRDGWPNPKAVATASGATPVLDGVRVYETTEDAVAELHHLYATTVRSRDMAKPALTPRRAVAEMQDARARGARVGILFGGERAGLANEDVVLADAIIHIPVNPAFGSLNLAMAVAVIGYEWFTAQASEEVDTGPEPATRAELHALFAHLEGELDARNYFRPPERRTAMVRNLRNMILRSRLSEQDVRSLRGIIKALTKAPGTRKGGD